MKSKVTLWLLIAAFAVGAFIWLVEPRLESTGQRIQRGARFVRLQPERLAYVGIEQPDMFIECRKRNDGWHIVKPMEARADAARVERLLHAMEDLPREDVITRLERKRKGLNRETFGLSMPRARILFGNDAQHEELLVGGLAPLPGLMYVKMQSSGDIIVTTTNLLGAIPRTVNEWRHRRIFACDAGRVGRIEIVRRKGGVIQLSRRDGGWVLQQPMAARADGPRVERLLKTVCEMEVQVFVSDGGSDPNASGLGPDEAAVQVALWTNGDESGTRLLLSEPAASSSNVFARLAGVDCVYAVSRSIVDALSVHGVDLRDRKVFPTDAEEVAFVRLQEGERAVVLQKKSQHWYIKEPLESKADDAVVADIVKSLTALEIVSFLGEGETNLPALGLQPAALAVTVAADIPGSGRDVKPDGKPAAPALFIGDKPREGDVLAAKFENDSMVFDLAAAAVRRFSEGVPQQGRRCTDALSYRDRLVLSLNPADVRSFSLARGGREQTIERSQNGTWRAVSPAGVEIQGRVVEDLLARVSGLKALRIEEDHARNVAAFGLNESSIVLTVGLSGKEGIQKRLLLGHPARSNGVYAMIQGQDLVFVLDKAVADSIMRDFVKPVPAEPPATPGPAGFNTGGKSE